MQMLAPIAELQGELMGEPTPEYLMYRPHYLLTPDGKRRYEFLIEYDIYNPSQGIYFGCKSITLPGNEHSSEIENALSDWLKAKPHILQRLNNIFPEKDFTHRFKDTDNANDNTFWPFWITLYEDEDPKEVGVRAVEVIAGVYRQLIDGTLPEFPHSNGDHTSVSAEEKPLAVRTAFTEEAFMRLKAAIEKNTKSILAPQSIPNNGWHLFTRFLKNAEEAGIISRVAYYEKAWQLAPQYTDIDFTCMIQTLFSLLRTHLTTDSLDTSTVSYPTSSNAAKTPIRIPWNDLLSIFLRPNGTSYKLQVKTLHPVPSTKKSWLRLLTPLLND